MYPNCPNKLFQYHHQPLNYFASLRPRHAGAARRTCATRPSSRRSRRPRGSRCQLQPVSLIKPIGAENEHPGYASEHTGSDHLVDLLQGGPAVAAARRTRWSIVTYDEFGGQWDHVPPPGQGSATPRPHDEMGPGTRIPALTIAPGLPKRAVDHASHDTTSIMATIEHRFGLPPVTARDARVQDLSTVFGRRSGRR